MRKSYSLWPPNNPGNIARLAVAVLLIANLAALYFVFFPPGGSPAELRQQLADQRIQLRQRLGSLDRTKKLAAKIEAGREEGNDFLSEYFLQRRAAYPELLAELNKLASESNIRPKEASYATEPVEGSDTLGMMQISASFEGTYGDLIKFINLIDRSDSLLIVESLNATPQQGNKLLNVVLKIDTFVREDSQG